MKPFKETSSLVAILKCRGLEIDRVDGESFLYDFNYYRFTGYSRQFQSNPETAENRYLSGAKFSEICSIIELDSELRRLLGEALSIVELSLRARFAHESARIFGEKAFYLDAANYKRSTPRLDALLTTMQDTLKRSKSRAVARYKRNDDFDNVPIWVAVEVFSFGSIAKMIMYLDDETSARLVADSYSVAWEGFQSTVHAFSVLRNRCAHHGQIWHRKLTIQVPVTKKLRPRDVEYDKHGSYPAIVMLQRYLRVIRPGAVWAAEIENLLCSNQVFLDGVLKPLPK